MSFQGSRASGMGAPSRPASLRVNSMVDSDAQTALHAAVSKEHLEVVKHLLGGGPSMSKMEARGWTARAIAEQQGNKNICDLLLSYESRRKPGEHQIEFSQPDEEESNRVSVSHFELDNALKSSFLSTRDSPGEKKGTKSARKRVVIHEQCRNQSACQQFGKLISLPDSIDELFKIAGKPLFLFCALLS